MNRAERRRAARQRPGDHRPGQVLAGINLAGGSDVAIFSEPGCSSESHLDLVGGIMMALVDPDGVDDFDPAYWLVVEGSTVEWECGCVFRVGRMPERSAPG